MWLVVPHNMALSEYQRGMRELPIIPIIRPPDPANMRSTMKVV